MRRAAYTSELLVKRTCCIAHLSFGFRTICYNRPRQQCTIVEREYLLMSVRCLTIDDDCYTNEK